MPTIGGFSSLVRCRRRCRGKHKRTEKTALSDSFCGRRTGEISIFLRAGVYFTDRRRRCNKMNIILLLPDSVRGRGRVRTFERVIYYCKNILRYYTNMYKHRYRRIKLESKNRRQWRETRRPCTAANDDDLCFFFRFSPATGPRAFECAPPDGSRTARRRSGRSRGGSFSAHCFTSINITVFALNAGGEGIPFFFPPSIRAVFIRGPSERTRVFKIIEISIGEI